MAVLGILLFLGLTGHLVYRSFSPAGESISWGESLFRQFFAGFLLCGEQALLLAEAGLFSPLLLGALLLVESGLVVALRWKHFRRWRFPGFRWGWRDAGTLLLFLAIATLLAWPGEWVLGGQDPGVYVLIGTSIARTGGIILHNPSLASMPLQGDFLFSSYIGQRWLLPGFYLTDRESGRIIPQFLHLYPSWLALFDALGGVSATLLATPLFTLLGLLAFYFLVRRLVGRWAAPVAVTLLALNPAQIWFAREPGAESLTLALLLGGWYLFERALHEPARSDLAVLAGAALGQIALAKLEFLFLPLLLYGYLVARGLVIRTGMNEKAFLWTYSLFLVHALVHMALISWPYLQTFRTSLERSYLLPAWAWFFLLGLTLAGLVLFYAFRRPFGRLLLRLVGQEERIRRLLILLGLLAVLYGAVLWPLLSPAQLYVEGEWKTNYHRQAFLRLLWYLSPVGLALAIVGLLGWLGRRLDGPSLPFFAAFALEGAIFVHSTMDYPSHFWMMRRYIPLVFPCLTLGMAAALYFLRWAPLGRTVRRGGVGLLLGLQLLLLVQADAPFASRYELAGMVETLAGLAERIPAQSPVFVDHFGAALATPLRFLYEKEAFALPQPIPWEKLWRLLREWPAEDGLAYLLLERPPSLLYGGMRVTQVGNFVLESWVTESPLDHLPREAVLLRSAQGLYQVERRPDGPSTLEYFSPQPEWSGERITLVLPASVSPLCLKMRAIAFRPETVSPALVQFLWNGETIVEVTLPRSPEPQETAVPLPPTDSESRLEIRCRTWNPRLAGFGDDPRDLGLLIQSLVVGSGNCYGKDAALERR